MEFIESGIPKDSDTCYSIPFLFVENHFAFTRITLYFNLQDIEQNF